MQSKQLIVLALIAPAAGCTSPPPVTAPAECDNQAAQSIVGKAYTTALGEEAKRRTHAQRVRVVRPGEMVTMDFDSRRLTIDLDAQGKVVRARCS
jgi:hypothetical protein